MKNHQAKPRDVALPQTLPQTPDPQQLAALSSENLGDQTGQALPEAARTALEPRFAHQFSKVRVFDDSHAHRLADHLDADAFTVGSNIFFAANRYAPSQTEGQELLGHELAHVAQNERFGANTARLVSDPGSRAEREASQFSRAASPGFAGHGINHGVSGPSISGPGDALVQRQSRGHGRGGARRHREPELRPDIAAGRFPSGDAARIISVHPGELIPALESARWPAYLPSSWGGWNTMHRLNAAYLTTHLAELTSGGLPIQFPEHEESFPGGTFRSHMNLRARMTNIRQVNRDGVRLGTESHDETGAGHTGSRSDSDETSLGAEHSGITASLGHTSTRGREDTASDSHSFETSGAAQPTGMFSFDLEFEVDLWQSFDVGTGTGIVNSIGTAFGGDDYGSMLQHSVVPAQTIVTESTGNMARFPLSAAH